MALFGIFWQLIWPIFIPGQFVISPYRTFFYWSSSLERDRSGQKLHLVALFCHFGNFFPNLVPFFGHMNFTVHGSTSLNCKLPVYTYKEKHILALFGIFWHFLANLFLPILILGQFVTTPYSNIFWLVHRFIRNGHREPRWNS